MTTSGVVSGSARSRAVAPALVVCSLLAYVVSSAWLANEIAGVPYRRFLYTLVDGGTTMRFVHGVTTSIRPAGLATTALFLTACMAAGIAGARAARGAAAQGPDRLVWGVMSAILPALLLATLGWPDGRGMLGSIALIATAALLAAAAFIIGRRAAGEPAPGVPPGSEQPSRGSDVSAWWLAMPLAALALLAASVIVSGLTTVQGFDSFGYHLPLAARWLSRSALVTGPEASLNLFYPGNFELLLRWAVALGGDHAAWIPSFASLAGCVYVLYRICLELGQPRRIAAIAAISAASLPVLARLASSAYSDVFVVLMLLLAVWALLRWTHTGARSTGLVAAMGASLGVAAGTKYSALPPALVIVGAWAWRAFLEAPSSRDARQVEHLDWRWIMRQAGVLGGMVLLGCGYWYLRNAIEHGNPLFPVAVAGLPGVPMDYLIPRVPALAEPGWRWAAYPWGDFEFRGVVEGGLGPTFAVVALVGIVLAPFQRDARASGRGVVWVVMAGSLLLWLGTRNVVPRYGLFPLTLAFVFVGELWIASRSRVIRIVTTVCMAGSMLVTANGLVTDAIYATNTGRTLFIGLRPLVDTLAPTRILNAVGSDIAAPAGYELLGTDYRHDVVTTYADAEPADVVRHRASYVLLQDTSVARYAAVLELVPAGRVAAPDTPPVSLWRVGGSRR